ncbi:GDSL-type esterase/lipase family protein [Mucilaginibacter calamicampi]|uniref:GDSL-type esterase/lipase family protein n=1 Tax=Mucilaginibacter calamicampi TaxID=1302352 RepID=A0ABW2YXT4_9SPHI
MFWYEDEVKRLERQRLQDKRQPATLFYGSSSIRLWDNLSVDFKDFDAVNLGFGGSTLAACTWFFNRVMAGYKPKRLVLYAGDNDLGDGRHPEEVFLYFQQFAARVMKKFGPIPCYFISLKPSINRWGLINSFKFTNDILLQEIKQNQPNWRWIDIYNPMLNADGYPDAQYFLEDGLHLSQRGYLLWKDIIRGALIA